VSWTQRLRRAWQLAWLGLFLFLMAGLARGDPRAFPFSVFHEGDPLSVALLAVAAGTVPRALLLGVALLLVTLLVGRAFCGWVCPLGTLQELTALVLTPRTRRESLEVNRWRPWQGWKYLLLAFLLALALLGSTQAGLLDPLSLLTRGLASGLWPILPRGREVPGGWLAALLLLGVLLASRWVPRFFCRVLCPLGALLGVFGRLAPFRLERKGTACTDCRKCTFACQGADDPLGEHRPGECLVCLECLDGCPDGALTWGFRPVVPPRPAQPDARRRHLVGAVLSGLVLGPVFRAAGGGRGAARSELIRPPGATGEDELLDRCVKCMLCGEACPTGAIQPATFEAGLEGFWTPLVVPRRGGCELACTRCGEACPTGALTRLTAARKTGYDGKPPVRIGTAFFDRGRCLPWANQIPCIVCEEMCPTDPKAIVLHVVEEARPDGTRVRLQKPQVEPSRCVGCGICENRCPVGELAGVRVSAVGESRHPLNRMVLGG
jgi:MauM/NapG family ferredoxin protein